ncbi:MAG: GntR family transcriptional regulator [Deltaproteobacteria bacterium]|nr:GntR family transcriptional regulator [Deltaproteobacteria bacterium]
MEPHPAPRRTLVEHLVDDLARQILRGEVAVGSHLPTMRQLAHDYGVTVATAQRAVARLEEMGLISARQGSGLKVRDARREAGPGVLPHWFAALTDAPAQAASLLGDVLELRRQIAVHLMLNLPLAPEELQPATLDLVEGFRRAQNPEEAMEIDLMMARTLLALSPQVAYGMMLNLFEQLLRGSPLAIGAIYGEPEGNAAAYRAAFTTLRDEPSPGRRRAKLESLLEHVDRRALDRLMETLEDA